MCRFNNLLVFAIGLVAGCGGAGENLRRDPAADFVGTRLVPDEKPQTVCSCLVLGNQRVTCGFLTRGRCRKLWVDRAGNTHPMTPPEFSRCPEQTVAGREIAIRLEGYKTKIPVGVTDDEGKLSFDPQKKLPPVADTDTPPASRAWARVRGQDRDLCEVPLDDYREWYLAEQNRLRTARENHQIAALVTRSDSFECLRWLRNHDRVADQLQTYLRGRELARCAADELVKQARASLDSGAVAETRAYLSELNKLLPDHPELSSIDLALKRLEAEAKQKKARLALEAGDFRRSRNLVIECLALIANHPKCSALAARINTLQIQSSWKRGMKQLEAGHYKKALGIATDCLNIRQDQAACRKLEAIAEVVIANPQPEIQTGVDSLKTRLWVELVGKTGTGIVQTEPFVITADKWRVDHANNGGGILQVTVHRGRKMLDTVVKTNLAGKGHKILEGKGTHFLKINSANTRWTVSVKQFIPLEEAARLHMDAKKARHKTFLTVAQFSGQGSQTTRDFSVEAERWKIEYRNAGSGYLQIMVYQGDRHVSTAANMTRSGEGESWIYEPGRFRLKINSAGTRWKVKVLAPP